MNRMYLFSQEVPLKSVGNNVAITLRRISVQFAITLAGSGKKITEVKNDVAIPHLAEKLHVRNALVDYRVDIEPGDNFLLGVYIGSQGPVEAGDTNAENFQWFHGVAV